VTFILNLYKAFGIRKSRLPSYGITLHSGGDSRSGKGLVTGGDERYTRFRTRRKAMTHAIDHVKQHPDHSATIKHNSPNQRYDWEGGENRLHHIPGGPAGEPMELALTHMLHGQKENANLAATAKKIGDDWYDHPDMETARGERDVAALNRMKSLHESSLSSLGDTPMHIDTSALYDLPQELHTEAPWGEISHA